MTIQYPDVSNYQAGLSLAGAPAAMAKATEGTTFRDLEYTTFRAQALAMGVPFCGYHYQREGDPAGQAAFCHGIVGATPLMLDVELGGSDGSWPSQAEVYAFIDGYRAGGGLLTTAYIPEWFWAGYWGSPSLAGLTQRGVALISSHYTAYSDGGPGWAPYGGVTPAIWQFTSTYPFNGYGVDMNAFKGSAADLAALFNGSAAAAPTGKDNDMHLVRSGASDGSYYFVPGFAAPSGKAAAFGIGSMAMVSAYQAAGAAVVQLPNGVTVGGSGYYDIDPQPWPAGGGTAPPGPLNISIAGTLSGTGTPAK